MSKPKTVTTEFEFIYQVVVGQLSLSSGIQSSKPCSILGLYEKFAGEHSELLSYKDAEDAAGTFRDNLYTAIRDTVRKHFVQNEGVTLEDVSITDFDFDYCAFIDADLNVTIDGLTRIQVVIYVEDRAAFDRNELLSLVTDRFRKSLRDPKYAKNIGDYYEVSISEFIER